MAVYFISIVQLSIYLIFNFIDSIRGTRNYQFNMATYGRRSHVHAFLCRYYHLDYVFFIGGCHWKEKNCLFYYVRIHISQTCTFLTKIQAYHLTWSVLCTCIIFRFFPYVAIVPLLRRLESVGICWNHIHTGFTCLSQDTNVIEFYLLFIITNLESGFAVSLKYM